MRKCKKRTRKGAASDRINDWAAADVSIVRCQPWSGPILRKSFELLEKHVSTMRRREVLPSRVCTSHGTCPMDHRARNALATSRRTRGHPVPVAAAHQRTTPRTTHGRRTNHPDALGNDANGNTHPTPRPQQKQTPTGTFSLTAPSFQRNKTPTSLPLSGQTKPQKSNIRTTSRRNPTKTKRKVANSSFEPRNNPK